jgi:hypothetical protein
MVTTSSLVNFTAIRSRLMEKPESDSQSQAGRIHLPRLPIFSSQNRKASGSLTRFQAGSVTCRFMTPLPVFVTPTELSPVDVPHQLQRYNHPAIAAEPVPIRLEP